MKPTNTDAGDRERDTRLRRERTVMSLQGPKHKEKGAERRRSKTEEQLKTSARTRQRQGRSNGLATPMPLLRTTDACERSCRKLRRMGREICMNAKGS